MKHVSLLLALAALLLLAGIGLAEGLYTLDWWTVDGGGVIFSTGGDYSLVGTIGQSDAGTMSGGDYTLAGGFWGGVVAQYRIYLPLVVRNYS